MDEQSDSTAAPPVPSSTCARCERRLSDDDRVDAGDRAFCRSCYEVLRMELRQMVAAMSQDINYPMAAVGALLGGAAGAALWWGFTVATKIAFGLVAVAIGFLAGHGAVRFSGNKRSLGLQLLATGVSLVSFLMASYLVNMTFVNRALAERGQSLRLGIIPESIEQFVRVVSLNFGVMDLVFAAIVVWQAWVIPRAPRISEAATP